MSLVTFKLACDNCMTMDRMTKSIIFIDEGVLNLYKNHEIGEYISKKEMQDYLYESFRLSRYCCEFCGKPDNYAFLEIAIDDKELED